MSGIKVDLDFEEKVLAVLQKYGVVIDKEKVEWLDVHKEQPEVNADTFRNSLAQWI